MALIIFTSGLHKHLVTKQPECLQGAGHKNLYLNFLVSLIFSQNKIIKISLCRSDLISIRNDYPQSNSRYNYYFLLDTSKTKEKSH